jgi:hypothetical protein
MLDCMTAQDVIRAKLRTKITFMQEKENTINGLRGKRNSRVL